MINKEPLQPIVYLMSRTIRGACTFTGLMGSYLSPNRPFAKYGFWPCEMGLVWGDHERDNAERASV